MPNFVFKVLIVSAVRIRSVKLSKSWRSNSRSKVSSSRVLCPKNTERENFYEYKTNKIVLYLPILFIGLALASKSPKSRNKKINFILFGQSLPSDWPMKRIITFYIPWIQSPKTKQFCSLKTIKYWKIFGILELN